MNLFKATFLIFCLSIFVNAKDYKPSFEYMASGGVNDLVYKNNLLYAATSASSVDIFDIEKKSKIESIKLPKIKDFMGDIIDSKIYSVDVLDKSILILSQGQKGGRALNIFENKELTEILSDKQRMFIAKAKFIDKNTVIFALLSNQVYLYDINEKKVLKQVHVSYSKFSDFVLDEKKQKIIVADESGILTMLNTKDLSLIDTFDKQNLDNVFDLDIKNGMIITAGQDRRSAVYTLDKKTAYYKNAPFLIYSATLSPSSKLGAIAVNEQNDVKIFDTNSKKDLHMLLQNPATLTNILFINEKEIFVASDHEKINYYKID